MKKDFRYHLLLNGVFLKRNVRIAVGSEFRNKRIMTLLIKKTRKNKFIERIDVRR